VVFRWYPDPPIADVQLHTWGAITKFGPLSCQSLRFGNEDRSQLVDTGLGEARRNELLLLAMRIALRREKAMSQDEVQLVTKLERLRVVVGCLEEQVVHCTLVGDDEAGFAQQSAVCSG
jgi:hypothetical protein